jgi:hypothetical protein
MTKLRLLTVLLLFVTAAGHAQILEEARRNRQRQAQSPTPTATPAPQRVLEQRPEAPQPLAQPQPQPQQPQLQPAPPPPQISADPGDISVNDTARLLAGMPVSEGSPLTPYMRDPSWQRHAAFFDKAWAKMDVRQLQKIRAWQTEYLPEALEPIPVAYYMFSGPDFLYVDQFFPNASVYVLCGTEPIGPLPDATRLGVFAGALTNLENALNSVLSFSFFITKDMKNDLQHEELKGTLPIFYVFLARAGKTITDVTFVSLNKSGTFQETAPGKAGGLTPGVRISYTSANGGAPQTMFYFTTDVSDDGIKSNPGFLKFCQRFGTGSSFLKSASYLMHQNGFNTVRNFLLQSSNTIVQDDSGIPIAAFRPDEWRLRLFGNYLGPIDLFKDKFQPQLQQLYGQSNPAPLEFGFGYRWSAKETTLIVASRK